jgi:hypothetical protein
MHSAFRRIGSAGLSLQRVLRLKSLFWREWHSLAAHFAAHSSVEIWTGEAFNERNNPQLHWAVNGLFLHSREHLPFDRAFDRLQGFLRRRDSLRRRENVDQVPVVFALLNRSRLAYGF